MKSRKVKSKIWRDSWFAELSRASKLLFMYLITCDDMGLSGYAEIPDRVISFDTGLTQAEIDACKEELSPKIKFAKDWVYVANIQKHDPIKGENNTLHKAFEREMGNVPEEIIVLFDAPSMPHISPIDGVIGIGKGKGKGNINSIECLKDKKLIQEISDQYRVSEKTTTKIAEEIELYCQSHGKKYKNYKATLQTWVRRRIEKEPTLRIPASKIQNHVDDEIDPEGLQKIREMKAKLMGVSA